MAKRKVTFEAVINGGESIFDSIDPVVCIIIDNGFHQYEFAPEAVQKIEVRPLRASNPDEEGKA